MKYLMVVFFLIGAILVSCAPQVPTGISDEPTGAFSYYYDEAHDVSIWIWQGYRKGGIAVLPGKEVQNPYEPMRFRERNQ